MRQTVLAFLIAVAAGCGSYSSTDTFDNGPGGKADTVDGVPRIRYESGGAYLVIEVLDDDLAHFEVSRALPGAGTDKALYTTPMVARRDYSGPKQFSHKDNVVETGEMKLTVDPGSLCVHVYDKAKGRDLSTVCPRNLDQGWKGLSVERQGMRNVYGLGNYFYDPATSDGDWVGRVWQDEYSGYGNFRREFYGAAPSVSQFPVFYALGEGKDGYGFFLDQVYKLRWDFTGAWWTVETWGDQLRYYVMTGPDLPDLRRDFMELVGKPLVPPRSVFGLWVSEFGYDSWAELEDDLASLRKNHFPVDGFALDTQWFGANFDGSPKMGTLAFDAARFPDAASKVRKLLDDGVNLMTIEESYVDARIPEHKQLVPDPGAREHCYLARKNGDRCDPVYLTNWQDNKDVGMWWGRGGMIDWTNADAGDFWHDLKRHKLAKLGITSHWCDLSEPEMFDRDAWYAGFPEIGKHGHGDIHNLYGFLWLRSIHRGYFRDANQAELREALGLKYAPRFYAMSRGGAPGLQRFGAGMWSGDIARNMGSLRAHLNTQMHITMAGLDYYSSDTGGFTAYNVPKESGWDEGELYTQWFAVASLVDLPLRPHGWALGGEETHYGPDLRGHRASNLANLRQRYELHPYVYSLAHRAYRLGEPIFPPLFYYHQEDLNLRKLGNVKQIGPSLAFGIIANFGERGRPVHLPAGRWANYHTNEWFTSRSSETPWQDAWRDGAFRLPLYAKAGAIIPTMWVDDQTQNIAGKRADGSKHDDLVVRVFADEAASEFTLYEDDGKTIGYISGQVRETVLTQQQSGNRVTVGIDGATGKHEMTQQRNNIVLLTVDGKAGAGVTLDGKALPECKSGEFAKGTPCWENAGRNVVRAQTGSKAVGQDKRMVFTVE